MKKENMGLYFEWFCYKRENINQVVPQGLCGIAGEGSIRDISAWVYAEGNYPVEKDKLMIHGSGQLKKQFEQSRVRSSAKIKDRSTNS